LKYADRIPYLHIKDFSGWVTVEQDLFPVKSFDAPLPLATEAYKNLKNAGF
jgi:inosose dehydratase